MIIENELTESISLDGEWDFSLAGGPWQTVLVPGAWDMSTADKITDGPALYRRRFQVPASGLGQRRLVLEFGAVSFSAAIRVNQAQVAAHRGMWSPFQVDITKWVAPGENELEVEVWKPGKRYPVRESLAGFLPDVATAFGGLWQSVRLLAVQTAFADLKVLCQPGGRVLVSGLMVGVDEPGQVEVEIAVRNAARVQVRPTGATGLFKAELDLHDRARWRAAAPTLHAVSISAWQSGQCLARASRKIGLRDVAARGGALWLDDDPLSLRGVLDWGWQPELIRPAPSRAAVNRQIEQARALGFNLVKLCLVVPDETTFEAADEAGQYLWLEMPLWLPRLTPAARNLARQEYEAVFRRVHHHPSIAVLSLGCELNAEADAAFLAELHALARAWFPDALLCDNSGSAEAYGGVTTSLQDFYDYHFYTDPHFFRPLLDHFERGYRARKPWLFGEFCDADTARDFSRLSPPPWWLTDPLALDRDDFLYTRDYHARLATAGIHDGGAALTRIARQQATAVRKYILEQTRLHGASGGYVVSGWTDTPITTSGIVDDQGELKFDGTEWQRFNADGVLLLEQGRRRLWVAGGDRPAPRDPYSWWAGEPAEVHVLLSNAVGAIIGGRLDWRLTGPGGAHLASGSNNTGALPAAEVSEVVVLSLPAPAVAEAPAEMELQTDLSATLADGREQRVSNRWSLWRVPRPSLGEALSVVNLDAVAGRHDLEALDPAARLVEASAAPVGAPVLACELTTEVVDLARAGRQVLLWVDQPDRRVTRSLPFWREAIHVFQAHPLWQAVPQPGYADLRFFGIATDLALDLARLQDWLGPGAECRPVWRRFDARALTWADYLIEVLVGRGRLLVSSLRFAGGLGCQPHGLRHNPWGGWMLAALLRPAGAGGI